MEGAAETWIATGAAGLALACARASALVFTAAIWGEWAIGWRIRLLIAAALTALSAPWAHLDLSEGSVGLEQIVSELAVGAAIGLSASLIIAASRLAGDLAGMQAGLAPDQWLQGESSDPSTQGTVIGAIYGWIAIATYLAADGPLAALRALAESYRAFPPGTGGLNAESVLRLMSKLDVALGLGLKLSAPAVAALIMAGLAMGVVGRTAPWLSLLASTMPIRFLLGMLMILLGLGALIANLSAAWTRALPLGL